VSKKHQATSPTGEGNNRLFDASIEEQILLSVHLMGKPTAEQLFRLYQDQVGTLRRMQGILRRLSTGPDRMLNVIKPMDIAKPIRSLPYIYLDTTRSRRLIEQLFGVPFRRVPPVPSRDWRFLRHDVEMCDELVAFELTARKHNLPFGYEPHYDADGKPIYPEVTIHHDGLTHTLRPQPDKTLIIGDYHVILEHDCGHETIECGNIIRDATIGRKHLVYNQLFDMEVRNHLGWGRTIVVYVIDSNRGTAASSRRRLASCIRKFPTQFKRYNPLFITRQVMLWDMSDLSEQTYQSGEGGEVTLGCFKRRSRFVLLR
jgi:hypothetical protein